jgi:hypothetical protein
MNQNADPMLGKAIKLLPISPEAGGAGVGSTIICLLSRFSYFAL